MAINPYDLAAVRNARMKKPSAVVAMKRRIRELEAELQVRDNMGNEVLRILREATGRRDFHSEMEAAEWAARMLADARLDAARYRHLCDRSFQFADVSTGEDHRNEPFVRFRPSFDIKEPASFPNCYEDEEWTPSMIDAAIDAAIKGAK